VTAFALRSQRLLLPDGERAGCLVIADGELIAITDSAPAYLPTEDWGSTPLMPGFVDCHVHINEPGNTDWEGFETATRAAAAGGITTLVDMPLNSLPVTTTVDALRQKLAAAQGKLHVDCGFWGGVVPGNLDDLLPMLEAGVLGFKAFLIHSGLDDFPAADAETLMAAMQRLAPHHVPLLAHAELDRPQDLPPLTGSPQSYARYLASRPSTWEEAAIEQLLNLCARTGCPTHIVHLATADALPMLARARARGLPVTVETCPHYLCLSAAQVPDGDTRFKCAPPIRDASHAAALWAALEAGQIDLIASDHSPCPPALKHLDSGDFTRAWGGIASLSLGPSLIWRAAAARGHTLADLCAWMSEGPARLTGLYPRKGALVVGADADIIAFDPDTTWTVSPKDLHHRHPISPYIGQPARGRVLATWVRGHQAQRGASFSTPRGAPILRRA
jgi:allantoinase